MSNLSFDMLRKANLARLPEFKNSKGQRAHSQPDGFDWTRADWFEALTGELGEYGNFSKKYRRGDIGYVDFIINARKELADVQIYLDLLAHRLGIDLGDAVIEKFNEVSKRIGCDVKL